MERERYKRTTVGIMRRLALVLTLALFAFGSAAEIMICGPELSTSSTAGVVADHGDLSISKSQGGHDTVPAGDVSCVHGHCHSHHSGAFMAQAEVGAADQYRTVALLTPAFETSGLPSAAHLGLERPPRV